MQASIVDLRYHMKRVLEALDRSEEVTVLYHGKVKAKIVPIKNLPAKKMPSVKQHPFFGMRKHDKKSVEAIMQKLRGGRFGDI